MRQSTIPVNRGWIATTLAVFLSSVQSAGPAAQDPTQNPAEQPGIRELQIEGDEITLSLNESTGLPLIDFIKLTESITGRVFTFQEGDFQGPTSNITFVGTHRVKRDQFFAFFQTMLYIKGFAVVIRGDEDSEIVEIVNMQGPKRSEINASATYVDPSLVANYATQTGVTILTSVTFEHINAQAAATAMRPFFSQSGAAQGGVLTGNIGDGRTMVLQGFGPQVYAASQLLHLADVAPEEAQIEYKVVNLEHATAEELEPILKQVMDERNRRPVGAAAAAQNVPASLQQTLNVFAHGSLNKLLLAGSPDRILEALDLIARLDVPIETGGGDIHVYQLKNVLAEDLQRILREFIREDQTAERTAQQAGGAGATTARQPRPTVIHAHPESNSLLISAVQSKYKQLERMIEQLDKRQPQVLIEAALVELTTDDVDRLGVELGFLDIGAEDFTRGFGFTSYNLTQFEDTDDDGLPDTRLPDFENPLQGLTGGIISSDDFAIPFLINAVQENDRANILSLPSVVVNNNESALVKSEEDRPTRTTNQGTATTQSALGESRTAGIELNISPSISSNDYLRLNIDLLVSRFLTEVDPDLGGPIIMRQVRTQITLPSGNTMVLGGIIEDAESDSESGVPLLKDIPLLGFLFKSRVSQAKRTNLYFFVTPTILDEDDFSDLTEISQRKKLEASEYIGHRRLKIVDPKWTGGTRFTLEDTGATVDDLDRYGGFEIPFYKRPESKPDLDGTLPNGPDLPDDTSKNGQR